MKILSPSVPVLAVEPDELMVVRALAHLRRRSHPGKVQYKIPAPEDDALDVDIVGLVGELVVHWWTGLPWSAYVRRPAGLRDVGLLEVRTRLGHDDPPLWIRTGDAPDAIVVLVTWQEPEARIVGWIGASTGRAVAHATGPTGDRAVGARHLRPLAELPDRYWPGRFRG